MADSHPEIQPTLAHQNPLGRKLKKILEIRLDNDKELVDSLKALSTFFGENSLRARRNLRGDVERRSLEISENFEANFREVNQKLEEICSDVQAMSKCCHEMTERLQKSKESTAELITKTTKLQNERKHVELQAKLADAFLCKYQLRPDEIKALRASKDSVMKEEFFNALARAKQIHYDCKVLLRSKQQVAGLEIMESMALYQETGYEKLYRWTQEECRGMTGDLPDVSGALCRAVEALQDRQILFKYTLDELGTARRTAVVRCFIDALTRGGPGGTPRPIELYSHDPVRYVGDILAWLHQAVAGEKELLYSLLKRTKMEEHQDTLNEILNHIIEGVCRPFKVRVEQVITSEPGPPILFKLGNLLKFYTDTLRNMIGGNDCELLRNLEEMNHLSHQMFYNSLSCYGSRLSDKVDLPPPDLSPSQVVTETLQLLKDVLASHDSAITPLNERRQDYEKIFSFILDPLLQCCMVAANQLNQADKATYMLNCLYQIQSTLAVYEFTDLKLEALATQGDTYQETLKNEQSAFIFDRTGLKSIFKKIKDNENQDVVLSSVSGLDNSSIKTVLNKFDHYLSHPDKLNMPQIELIRSTRMRDTIRKRATDIVIESYRTLYSALVSPQNGYINPTSLITRTPEDIEKLLK